MFCPECQSEYTEGITECRECGVALVENIPPQPEPDKFTEILSTFNLADIAVIKSILDDGDIAYFFLGEYFNQIEQLVQPARLFVREDQVYEAKEILKNVDIAYMGISSAADVDEDEK